MNEFFKWYTIAQIVFQTVANFVNAGGPSVNPILVANEAQKELKRGVAAGFLPADVLDDSASVIQAAIQYHPAVQNANTPGT
jgi:hypothetical protein